MRINKHTTDPFEINGKYANLEKGRRKNKPIEESLMGSEYFGSIMGVVAIGFQVILCMIHTLWGVQWILFNNPVESASLTPNYFFRFLGME
jgi:hypothetical protein